jgi:hypothetical protein
MLLRRSWQVITVRIRDCRDIVRIGYHRNADGRVVRLPIHP